MFETFLMHHMQIRSVANFCNTDNFVEVVCNLTLSRGYILLRISFKFMKLLGVNYKFALAVNKFFSYMWQLEAQNHKTFSLYEQL